MSKSEKGLFHSGPSGVNENNKKDMITKYLRYWYLFVAGIVLAYVAATLHILYNTTPQYATSSTVMIKPTGNETLTFGGMGGGNNQIGNEVIILKSRHLMHRVLSELGLNTKYYIEGRFKNEEVYKDDLPISLVVSRLDSAGFGKSLKIRFNDNNNFSLVETNSNGEETVTEHKFGQEINKNYAAFTILSNSSNVKASNDIIFKFQDIGSLADHYSGSIKVSVEEKAPNVLNLGLTDPVPQRSVLILDKLVEVYNKEAIEDKNQVQLSTINFLDERIQLLSMELTEVEKDVEQYKQQHNLTDVEANASMYLSSATEYNKELENLEVNISILNSLEQYLNTKDNQLVPSSLNIPDPTLNGLLGKFNELQLERQRMLRTIQPSSSLIQNIDDQLLNLRENIKENLRNIKNGMIITRNNLRASTTQYQSKIRQVPSIQRELMEINRQQAIKQEIYLFLLQKREETGLALASNTANSRIIDPATFGWGPVSPNKTSIYLGTILFGLLIPFGFVYVKELLNDKITDKIDVEKAGIPIVGEIMHGDKNGTFQILDGVHSVVAETFRLVRANLYFATMGQENKVILVTSSRSGEGKTFLSINLAASLALSGKKVIVLDFDLRKPSLMEDLELPDEAGVNDFLTSNMTSADSLIRKNERVKGLYTIGAGNLPSNPAESLMSPRVKLLIEELREKFDHILIDTSPIGMVADAFNLAPYTDSTLYVVRYNYSYKAQLNVIADIYENNKLSQPMIVLNDAKKKNGHSYSYGYGYGNDANGKPIKKKKRKTINV